MVVVMDNGGHKFVGHTGELVDKPEDAFLFTEVANNCAKILI